MNNVLLADTVANYDAVIVCFENTPATTDDKSTFAQSTFYYSYKRQSFSIRLANEYNGKTFIKFNNKTAETWGGDYLRLILGLKLYPHTQPKPGGANHGNHR